MALVEPMDRSHDGGMKMKNNSETLPMATEPAEHIQGKKVPYGSPVYNGIAEFLIDEALILDENRLLDWAKTLAEDLIYVAPVRTTRMNEDRISDIDRNSQHYDDDYGSVILRIRRFTESKSVWAENPRARTRRFVTNISVWETGRAGEYAVTSYLLLMKNKLESPSYDFITARRNDVLRLADGALKLARRESIIDMSVLGVPNLINFL